MNIKLINPENRTYRFLSVVLFYAFVLEISIPFARAMGEMPVRQENFRLFLPQVSYYNSERNQPVTRQHAEEVSVISMVAAGPGQTETSGFSLNSMDAMVNQFTGDFNYSIPLMDVEGYPITLSYNSNVGMHDEASWVGLGWNLNVGSIAREMRGIPDEFDGSQSVKRTYSVKDNDINDGYKFGVVGGIGLSFQEIYSAGLDFTLLWGKYTSNYLGRSKTFDFGVGARLSIGDQLYFGPEFSLGYSSDSKNGVGRSTSIGLQGGYETDKGTSAGLGLVWGSHYNSRKGTVARSLQMPISTGYRETADDGETIGEVGGSINVFGSSFNCGGLTSVPRLQMNSRYRSNAFNSTAKVSFKTGPVLLSIGLEYQDYSVDQSLLYTGPGVKVLNNPAYGYFHSEKRNNYTGTDNPIMDYNRERDQELSEETKNLQFSFPTYDVFHVSGVGMSASFRGERNDVGTYHDGTNTEISEGATNSVSAGVRFSGSGISFTAGYANSQLDGSQESGKWNSAGAFDFSSDRGNLFFKGIGEPTPRAASLLEEMEMVKPAYVKVQKTSDGKSIERTNTLVYGGGTKTYTSAALNAENGEEVIANIYTPLTASQLTATQPAFQSYQEGVYVNPVISNVSRTSGIRATNHLSEIEVTTAEGIRYQYGVPAYSKLQQEVSFSTSATSDTDGLAVVTATEASENNVSGRANLYDKTEVPAYATSFLLTQMVSSDYVDILNDGPSLEDPGNWIKINHTLIYGKDNANHYKWRFPISGGPGTSTQKAFFNKGLQATELDNMASYTYGEKEIWYTHSIESRNYVAEFELENRIDAYGANEAGILDNTKPLKRLKRIVLYSKEERRNNPSAKPLQIIEFEYDYSLCKSNPANTNTYGGTYASSGKLTLKKIKVYSGPVSQENALNPYIFTYSSENKDFSYKNTDRWGKFKLNDPAKPNDLFPYASQDPAVANAMSTNWKLVRINMPTGGEMEVSYESDTYKYVQNRRAMEHMKIEGYMNEFELWGASQGSTWSGSGLTTKLVKALSVSNMTTIANAASPGWFSNPSNLLQLNNAIAGGIIHLSPELRLLFQMNLTPNNVVIVKLNTPLPTGSYTKAQAAAKFKDTYLKDPNAVSAQNQYITELYLRNFVKVRPDETTTEMIPTFAKIASQPISLEPVFPAGTIPTVGVMPPNGGNYEYGYIVLENVKSDDDKKGSIMMNPVQKTALEFSRLHLTDKVYGSCNGCDPDLSIDKKLFWGGDVNKKMIEYGYCNSITTENSTVRLLDHDGLKYGGNARVSKITYKDKWGDMSGENNTEYTWNYKYDTEGPGVAAYEPAIGNDENPFYYWERYTTESISFPDESRFTVAPVGESLFPSPIVGYEKVSLELGGTYVNAANKLGKSISAYYTAYDKPTYVASTSLQKEKASKTNFVNKNIDIFGLSQGHTIVTSDFHGKPRYHEVYNRKNELQERSEYHYRDAFEKVSMLDKNSTVIAKELTACEYDISADTRFILSKSSQQTVGINLLILLPFVVIPMPVYGIANRTSGFYTHVLNKHINYSASLKSVETNKLGSKNTAEDLVYDRYTGSVLLTSLQDEFDDPLYSMNYPAHWYYKNFRSPLMHERSATFAGTGSMSGGLFTYGSSLEELLTPGDLVQIQKLSTTYTGHVLYVSGSTAKLIDAVSGFALAGTSTGWSIKFLKSGRKNRLADMMQHVTTKRNPVSVSGTTFTFPVNDVIAAAALTFKERMNIYCAPSSDKETRVNVGIMSEVGYTINPFNSGLKGNYVFADQFMFQQERSSTQTQGIRFNGTLVNYMPFYALSGSNWLKISQSGHPNYLATDPEGIHRRWRSSGQILTFDQYGKGLEGKTDLRIFTSVLYGYNRLHKLVPVAEAMNASQQQIAFDGFEDYTYMLPATPETDLGHFDFASTLNANILLTSAEKHSGLQSLKVDPSTSAIVTRPVKALDCAIPADGITDGLFKVNECMCIQPFAPSEGDYVIGAWMKGSAVSGSFEYTAPKIRVESLSSTSAVLSTNTFAPSGKIIDGWQRLEGNFNIPSGAASVRITLINTSGVESVYYDDLRIHPLLAGMNTLVYDPKTLLPMASHDAYNFTTFYNYDENLRQVRVRVETVEGIQTVSEAETSTVKQ